jgi:High potential iron-sulfur protein
MTLQKLTGQKQSEVSVPRRAFLKGAVLGVIAIPATSLCIGSVAQAGPTGALDEKDPQAKALGYVSDAGRVDAKSNPAFKAGQNCANCLQLTGKAGEAFRPCNLFPGKLVDANGWCKAWVKKA